MKFAWRVTGTEYRHSSFVRPFEDSDEIEAEGVGEALEHLIRLGEWWDMIDIDETITIEIRPVEDTTVRPNP